MVFLAPDLATVITTAVAFIDLGAFSVIVALAIAVLQDAAGGAVLHARAPQHAVDQVVLFGGLLWFGILMGMTFIDFSSRTWMGVPGR